MSEHLKARNDAIILQYQEGADVTTCADTVKISRERVRQILRKAGVWRKAAPRSSFLGIDVTPDTKEALKAEANRRNTSVSRLASDALEEMLKGEE